MIQQGLSFFAPIVTAMIILSGCNGQTYEVEFAEGETAELTLAGYCTYQAGRILGAPGRLTAKFKGHVETIPCRVADQALTSLAGEQAGNVTSSLVSSAIGMAINKIPGMGIINCTEVGGDLICDLVELGHRRKIRVSGMGEQSNQGTKQPQPKSIEVSTRRIKRLESKDAANLKSHTATSSKRRSKYGVAANRVTIRINAATLFWNRPSPRPSPSPSPQYKP
ncbi:MAG: hypothetical protein J5J00_16945 [Deltaproteobacteria bacterium]|nr:hypothetical protein [Deltaproteobacteria bacterium]